MRRLRKSQKTEITDFNFKFVGRGHYEVTYTSPSTGREWRTVTSNMPLIDATKNTDSPKRCDLNSLKATCKYGY